MILKSLSTLLAMMHFFFNYFDCEPFELNFRLHVLGGFWPLETRDKRKQIFFSIFSYICYFLIMSTTAIQILDLYLLRNDLVNFVQHLSVTTMSLAIVSKAHLHLYKIDLVNELKEEINGYKKTRVNESDLAVLEKSNWEIANIVKVFYALSVPCISLWVLNPALDSSRGKRYILPFKFPVEEWTLNLYIGLYVYQVLAIFVFWINVVSIDTIFCGFVLRINAQYEIIIKNLENLNDSEIFGRETNCEVFNYFENERLKYALKENIKQHHRILRELYLFEQIYSASSFIHFVLAIICISAIVMDSVVSFQEFKLEIFQRFLYLTLILWDTFLYCFYATKLREKSLDLSVAAYSTKWYQMKPAIRRNILTFIMKSQRAPKIYAGKLIPLELQSFVTLLKLTWTRPLYETNRLKKDT